MNFTQLNHILSNDKLRELWLKRVLPGIAVVVIYFVFISNILVANYDKAQKEYRQLIAQGVSEKLLPTIEQQKFGLQTELSTLQKQDAEVQASLASKAGFLFGRSDLNSTVEQVADLMQKYHLRIVSENKSKDKKIDELPPSFADVKRWLSDMLKVSEGVQVHQVQFLGSYVQVFEMLREIVHQDLKAIPLILDMRNPDPKQNKPIGLKAWTLELWV